MSNYKHLTLSDRITIQEGLGSNLSFTAIANQLNKHSTTISKEVKKHLIIRKSGISRKYEDGRNIEPKICPRLLKSPYVCNGCKRKSVPCVYDKFIYDARKAQTDYRLLLTEAREGIPLNKESFYEIESIIVQGLKQGQHLYHIIKTNNLPISKATVYRHLKKGYLRCSKLDFPRMPKFKAQRKTTHTYVPRGIKVNRTYADFLQYKESNNILYWVEADTVIGKPGGKVIMTFDFTICNFMFGLLLDNKTALEATRILNAFKKHLCLNNTMFGDIMPVILTDNGGEFSNVAAFENSLTGELESKLFFCDPMRSSQKPHVEKNHTLLRDIVPKGSSFECFSQETVNLIFSHINGIRREILQGKTAYEVFTYFFSEKTAELLGINHIQDKQVIQSPKLLKTHILNNNTYKPVLTPKD
jgi:transposase, IS30 family